MVNFYFKLYPFFNSQQSIAYCIGAVFTTGVYRGIPGGRSMKNQNDTTISLQKPLVELRTKTSNTYTSHCTTSDPYKGIFYFRKMVLKLRYLTALLRGMLMIHG